MKIKSLNDPQITNDAEILDLINYLKTERPYADSEIVEAINKIHRVGELCNLTLKETVALLVANETQKLSNKIIDIIEKALDIKLHPWQIDYIFYDKPFPGLLCPCLVFRDYFNEENLQKLSEVYSSNGHCSLRGRRTGFTTAYCIKIALFSQKILDLRNPEEFSDWGDGSIKYARTTFQRKFLHIWTRLRKAGLPVAKLYQGGEI